MKSIKTFVFLSLTSLSFSQGLKVPVKSPLATVKQAVGLSEITLEYSRPSKRGREIFGSLEPYGEVWRTGANASTKITFGEDVIINSQNIKAGTYSLYTIPNEKEWIVILNKNLTLWGDSGYQESEDVARFSVPVKQLTEVVETFTIEFTNIKPTALTIELKWDQVKVALDLSVNVDETIMKNIASTMTVDKRPYHQAAQYYYDNNKDMKQALEWAKQAFEINPAAYWSGLLKAKIQVELNDLQGAKETAMIVKKLAETDGNQAYVKQADEIIQKVPMKKATPKK